MTSKPRIASVDKEAPSSRTTAYSPLIACVVWAMEAVLLALICLSPWAYGAVHPGFEFLLDAGIAVLLALWAARMLLEGLITWKNSAVAICLAWLFLLGIWQSTPLPRHVLDWLAPTTVRCYDQLLPQQPETLPNDAARCDASIDPGSTLSLYPGATQREATRLLAVLLVFVIVYNNLTSQGALIRLSWLVLLNGAVLSLFALFQFFAAPRNTVYWIFSTQRTPFGPFICHNHFPDYVNMCIGLGIGLLASQRRDHSSTSREEDVSLVQMLRNPRVLWICSALGLMLTAVAFSGSRGGLLALVGAAVICGVLGRLRLGSSFRLGPSLVVAAVVLALSAWFGTDLIKDRLATLESGEAFESRLPLWLRSLPIVPNFPIWGTGYGTFGYIEPMYRPDAPSTVELEPIRFDHAHNDYLELLVEGGVVGLGLVVLALVAVFRRGYRALTLNRGSPRAGLALGAWFAFTALALHSFGEFGSHIPAIALLATIVCAHLYALGQPIPHQAPSVNRDESLRLRLGGIAPLFGAIAAFGFGLIICADSWKAYRIDRLRDAAFRAGNVEADQFRTRIACLTEVVSLGPLDAQLHYELGLAHEQLAARLRGNSSPDRRAALEQRMLALQEYLHARDACPLLSGPQAGIASYASLLKRGEGAEDYMRRAKLLSPGQVDMWYVCGLRELMLNRPQDAWATWRHCLELSDQYLAQILGQTSYLKTNQLVEKVLPDKPDVLLAAVLRLYPDFGSVQRRRPFLEKALRLLESKEEGTEPQDSLVKARIYKALDQRDQAILSYRAFLNRDASQMRVRYEFASYLHEVGKLEDSQHELMVILAQESKSGAARSLLDTVVHDMLQEKTLQRRRQRDDWWSRHRQR